MKHNEIIDQESEQYMDNEEPDTVAADLVANEEQSEDDVDITDEEDVVRENEPLELRLTRKRKRDLKHQRALDRMMPPTSMTLRKRAKTDQAPIE